MKILQYNLKRFVESNKLTISVSLFVLFIIGCKQEKTLNTTSNSKENIANIYAKYIDSCNVALSNLIHSSTKKEQQNAFLEAREYFKKIEPIFLRFEKNNLGRLNGPNLNKIDEEDLTDVRISKPEGFQVLEETLFGDETIDSAFVKNKTKFIQSKLGFVKQNNFISKKSLSNFLEMIKLTVVNIALKGISGFDSPVLSNSLNEAKWNYEALIKYTQALEPEFKDKALYNTVINEFKNSIKKLSTSDFEKFDRYSFIKKHTYKELELINKIAEDWHVEMTNNLAMNFKSEQLFSKSFFNDKSFSVSHLPNNNDNVTALGEKLFYDKSLSKDKNMSCVTCHSPAKGFADGHKKAIGNNGQELLRNSPTIIYSQYQKGLFYDMRVSSLESQISSVINNKDEFHQDIGHIVDYVSNNETYKAQFKKYYKDSVTSLNIRHAISNYTRSLASFSSKFDNNINDKENTLTDIEKEGFNLFMGKAACATCHFPPLFNGTVPPNFTETELEIIGVPKTSNNQMLDEDLGRYHVFNTEERKFAFKTPTIRNINLTGPYMHNGIYDTLEQVMEFYNLGGGEGLGYQVPNQTLPFDNLDLSDHEIDAIIAFMKTLTDNT